MEVIMALELKINEALLVRPIASHPAEKTHLVIILPPAVEVDLEEILKVNQK